MGASGGQAGKIEKDDPEGFQPGGDGIGRLIAGEQPGENDRVDGRAVAEQGPADDSGGHR
jgi:hypothetical protein